jgi:hypothetical protein
MTGVSPGTGRGRPGKGDLVNPDLPDLKFDSKVTPRTYVAGLTREQSDTFETWLRDSYRPVPSFDDELAKCRDLSDPRWRAIEQLADAWGPALANSYQLGYAAGYARGHWDAEHEMAEAWRAVAKPIREVLAQPTRDELAVRRSGRGLG